MAEKESHPSAKEFVCMDGEPEFIPGTLENLKGTVLQIILENHNIVQIC